MLAERGARTHQSFAAQALGRVSADEAMHDGGFVHQDAAYAFTIRKFQLHGFSPKSSQKCLERCG
jgi:hypothetical protein